jgi:hypothetical protein
MSAELIMFVCAARTHDDLDVRRAARPQIRMFLHGEGLVYPEVHTLRRPELGSEGCAHHSRGKGHHLVFLPNPYESMQFLIDRGIDMTIKDYRWDATALGWARVAAQDEKMAQWLEEAERQREERR